MTMEASGSFESDLGKIINDRPAQLSWVSGVEASPSFDLKKIALLRLYANRSTQTRHAIARIRIALPPQVARSTKSNNMSDTHPTRAKK